jgi:ubiquinone/menaquinone biosynthesis C-methylase UbiE
MNTETTHKHYLPAAGSDWLLPFYDPFTRLLGVEKVHRLLIEQAQLGPGLRVLEIGSGTGNLALLAKRLYPDATIVGIDPDPRALARARRKALRKAWDVSFDEGFSENLPYPNGSFDRVLSSFMLHHVSADSRIETLRQARRVLSPTGTLHLADFVGAPRSAHAISRVLHEPGHVHADEEGDPILAIMRGAGFQDPEGVKLLTTLVGRVAFYRASVAA